MTVISNVDFSNFSTSLHNLMKKIYPMILRKLRYSDTMSQYLTTINSVEGVYQITNATVTSLLQGYQTTLTKKGKVSPDSELIHVKRYKIDFPYDPVDFYDRYISHLDENQLRPEQHPFEQYMIDIIVEKAVEDMQINAAKAVWKAPVEGIAGQAKHSFNGWLTELRRLVKEGKVIPIKTDAFTANTIVDWVEDFVDEISDLYQYESMMMLCSTKNSRVYSKDYRNQYGDQRVDDSLRVIKNVYDSGMTIRGDSSLAKEEIFLATPKDNFFRINSIRNPKPIEAQKIGRQHWVLQDGGCGFGFGLPEIVFMAGTVISAPALDDPAQDITADSANVSWEEVAGATGFRLDVSEANDFSSFVAGFENKAIDLSSLSAVEINLTDGTVSRRYVLSTAITGLNASTTYYVRLRAEIAVDNSSDRYASDNSDTVSFATTA